MAESYTMMVLRLCEELYAISCPTSMPDASQPVHEFTHSLVSKTF